MKLRLRVSPAAEKQVRAGHPWIYDGSIREQNREGEPGELAVVYDRNDRFLAIGFYDPQSPLRVRVVHRGKPQVIDKEWWRKQLIAALEKRHDLFDQHTNAYRCVHGESDGFPGLVLDRYANVAVLKLYSSSWLPRLGEIKELVTEQLRPDAYGRSGVIQDVRGTTRKNGVALRISIRAYAKKNLTGVANVHVVVHYDHVLCEHHLPHAP